MSDFAHVHPSSKVLSRDQLEIQVEQWKSIGLKIVFTNGCFDILHRGHIQYLFEASKLGDILIVGINSDESVQRLKGPKRPIQDEESRSEIIAALEFVDTTVIFGEDTPMELISLVRPDFLVKGGDYNVDTVVGAKEVLANGGEVKLLSFLPGYSTTNLENKIKDNS